VPGDSSPEAGRRGWAKCFLQGQESGEGEGEGSFGSTPEPFPIARNHQDTTDVKLLGGGNVEVWG